MVQKSLNYVERLAVFVITVLRQ